MGQLDANGLQGQKVKGIERPLSKIVITNLSSATTHATLGLAALAPTESRGRRQPLLLLLTCLETICCHIEKLSCVCIVPLVSKYSQYNYISRELLSSFRISFRLCQALPLQSQPLDEPRLRESRFFGMQAKSGRAISCCYAGHCCIRIYFREIIGSGVPKESTATNMNKNFVHIVHLNS